MPEHELRENNIKAALSALKEPLPDGKHPSVNRTALSFGISRASMRRAIANGGPPSRRGPPKVLTTHEEKQLIGYCLNMQKLGFGLTRSGVNHCVMEILRLSQRKHPFNGKDLAEIGGNVSLEITLTSHFALPKS